VKYIVVSEMARYLNVGATLPAKMQLRPSLLTTTDTFFRGKWVEQTHDRCYRRDGFVTDCKVPDCGWCFHATAQAARNTGCRRSAVGHRGCAIGGCNDNVGPFRTLDQQERFF